MVDVYSSFRRITKERHRQACERIDFASQQYRIYDWGQGPMRINIGVVHIEDVRAKYGYTLRPAGLDQFGWPVGHPDSPATPS